MLAYMEPESLWLLIMNSVLGIVAVACFIVMTTTAVRSLFLKSRPVLASLERDDHAFVAGGLGITMADGGKKIPLQKTIEDASQTQTTEPKKINFDD